MFWKAKKAPDVPKGLLSVLKVYVSLQLSVNAGIMS